MKWAIYLALFSQSVFAAKINYGYYDPAKDALIVNLSYSGGCAKHGFRLGFPACSGNGIYTPVVCEMNLLHNYNGDNCEAQITKNLSFSLQNIELGDNYYRGAIAVIKGEVVMVNYQTHTAILIPPNRVIPLAKSPGVWQ